MADLRWGLLLLGLLVIAAIYLYTRFKPQIDRGLANLNQRNPSNLPRAEPVILPETEVSDAPAVPLEPELSDTPVAKVVAIRLMARDPGGFPAESLILAMREHGLRHGQFGIFHHPGATDESRSEFSIANLTEPGSFDLTRIKTDTYPGVSVFLTLPGPENCVDIFDSMVTISRSLAEQLDGDLLDEMGSTLSIQRQRYMREEVVHFQHHGSN
jgi:cell division protein ZipA